jgi:energy-coupling factor transport system ATP-binding protein
LIELKNVTFAYKEEYQDSISQINLLIKKGEFVLLTGRSGSGKTTITRCINGLIPHFYEGSLIGKIFLGGKNILEMHQYEIAELVGSVFQDPRSQFFTADTTSEIVFTCENLGLPRKEILERLKKSVSDLRMGPLLERSIFQLSNGEKQRVAISSVYAGQPSIYVLDEPSANLDHQATEDIREILRLLKKQGNTILMAEHRLYYLRELVDRVIYLDGGRIVEEFDGNSFYSLSEEERALRGLRSTHLDQVLTMEENRCSNDPTSDLEVDNLCFSYRNNMVLADLCLKGSIGDIVGI